MKNTYLDAKTAHDIDQRIDRIHRDLGYVGRKIELIQVRELLRLDLQFYRLTDANLLDEVVHKLKVGGKQVLKRPGLLVDVVRKWDLNALFIPDRKRILIDSDVPELKQRWCVAHEVAHSLIPWHGDYMLGDDRTTLSQVCHERIEVEANYGAGRLIFPFEQFSEARHARAITLAYVRELAKIFGNTITSTLWRCVEQSEDIIFASIGEHPRHPVEGKDRIEYFIRSSAFERQFSNVTEDAIWTWMKTYCGYKFTGPLGEAEIVVSDINDIQHVFVFETFSNKHSVLTLARWVKPATLVVPSYDVPGLQKME